MGNNEDYNPFSNTHNPKNGSDTSEPYASSSAPFYSSSPTDSASNPYSPPTEPSPYGPPAGEHDLYGQPAASVVPFQGQNPVAPPSSSGSPYVTDGTYPVSTGDISGSASNPYASSGSAPAYQGPQSNSGYQYSGYGYNNGNMIQGNNSTALASLILGILGVTMILPFIGSLIAVILGYSAKKQIRVSKQEGTGLATAGLILGWIGLVFTAIGILFVVALISSTLEG